MHTHTRPHIRTRTHARICTHVHIFTCSCIGKRFLSFVCFSRGLRSRTAAACIARYTAATPRRWWLRKRWLLRLFFFVCFFYSYFNSCYCVICFFPLLFSAPFCFVPAFLLYFCSVACACLFFRYALASMYISFNYIFKPPSYKGWSG